jgi:hypothetical protein
MLNKKAREQLNNLLLLSMLVTKSWLIDRGLSLHF